MECTDTDIDADSEREEGEIFDDDLETISDDPMITPSPTMGKLNKTEGSLCALSLSSVSDLEILECSSSHSNPKYRRCGAVKKKKRLSRSYYSKSSSGSSSENEETRKTKKLLKDAIRRDTEIMQNNSLRTRLKNMIQKPMILEGPEANSPNDCDNLQDEHPCCGFVTETNASEDKEKGERETLSMDRDDELIQLRLEALKTAVINKFQRKKKMISNNQEESKTLETNKENSSDNVNTQVCNLDNVNCIEEIVERSPVVNTSSPNSAINSEEDIDEDEDILRAVLLASMAKKMTTKVPISKRNNTISNKLIKKELKPPHMVAKPNIDLPKAKPFIISINNPDSDSNEEFMDTEEIKSDKIIDEKELELKIDNFLKQQRAEVEAKAKSINISQTNINTNSQTNKNVETNSLYKLLPKNKQLEYEKLIQKLKTAEKKCKIKRISSRITDHKLQKNKSLSRTTESNSVTAVALQRQLRQMQQQVSGRLQNEKYQELSTLMERLKGANEEQKKHEIRIKYLLNQLKEARIESSKSQEVFSGLMKEFLKKKADIDSNAKGISQSGVELSKNGPASKTKNGSSTQKSIVPVNPKENGANVRNNYGQCKIVLEKCPANVVDPNDIEFKTIPKVENYGVPKYSSPLEYMKCKNKIQNPMEILCPFELDGLCRDKDCVYNHFNKDEN